MRLRGRTALVTGSGRSLGKAIALQLAQEGANVVVNSRNTPDEIDVTASEIRSLGVDSVAVVADVTGAEQVERMRQRVYETFGCIDIVVNNVGVSPYLPLLDLEPDDWHQIMSINLHTHISHINPAGLAAISNGTTRCSRIAEYSSYHECQTGRDLQL